MAEGTSPCHFFITVSVIQDSMETALNFSGDVIFTATAEFLEWKKEGKDLPHPNTMLFKAFRNGTEIASTRIFSIGGGSINIENEFNPEDVEVYKA